MNSLGLAGSGKPRVRPGAYDEALALLAGLTDSETKVRLDELRDATEAYNQARDIAEAATVGANERETEAVAAEAKVRSAQQTLSDETEKARDELGRRELAVAGRERAVSEVEETQDARDAELIKRAGHLHDAGVKGF